MTEIFLLRSARGDVRYLGYGDYARLLKDMQFLHGVRQQAEALALKAQNRLPVSSLRGRRQPDEAIQKNAHAGLLRFARNDVDGANAAFLYLSPKQKRTSFVGVLETADGDKQFIKRFRDEEDATGMAGKHAFLKTHFGDYFYIPALVSQRERLLRYEHLTRAKHYYSNDLQSALWQTSHRLYCGAQDKKRVPAHGDFTPWNVVPMEGGFALVDEEEAGYYPPFFDVFHFHLQPLFLKKKCPDFPEKLLREIQYYTSEPLENVARWYQAYLAAMREREATELARFQHPHLQRTHAHRKRHLKRPHPNPLPTGEGQGEGESSERYDSSPSVLCVHPNGELYGSDRMFLTSVRAFHEAGARLRVRIAEDGPLKEKLAAIAPDTGVYPYLALRRAKLRIGRLWRIDRLLLAVFRAWRQMAGYDLAYVNTAVLPDMLLAARFSKTPVVAHLHEVLAGKSRYPFALLLLWSGADLLAPSRAVRDALPFKRLRKRIAVVPNGVEDVEQAILCPHPNPLPRGEGSERNAFAGGSGKDSATPSPLPPGEGQGEGAYPHILNLLLPGRYHPGKGQTVLINAVALLPDALRNRVRVRLVGGYYGDRAKFQDAITSEINTHGLEQPIELHPFTPEPEPHYRWADIVVVPSTRPESFGLVAVEAMQRGKPVIASDLGGLKDIVEHDRTGRKVPAGDAPALALAIQYYLEYPRAVAEHGAAGRKRYETRYHPEQYARQTRALLSQATIRKRHDEAALSAGYARRTGQPRRI